MEAHEENHLPGFVTVVLLLIGVAVIDVAMIGVELGGYDYAPTAVAQR